MYFIQQNSQVSGCITPQQRKIKYMFHKNQQQTLTNGECQNFKIITIKTVLCIEEHNINEEKYKTKTELFIRTLMGSICCMRRIKFKIKTDLKIKANKINAHSEVYVDCKAATVK